MRQIKDFRKLVARAYRGTALYRVRELFAEESKWKRRETIARNKLADVRARIEMATLTLASEAAGVKEEGTP